MKKYLQIDPFVFVSYCHKDKEWLQPLQTFLQPLVRDDIIKLWVDTKIRAGQDWAQHIQDALDKACVAVLLVSPNFLASDYIANCELPAILNKAWNRELVILKVYLGHCGLLPGELKKFQAINSPEEPVNDLSSAGQQKVWKHLSLEVQKLAKENGQIKPVQSQFPQAQSQELAFEESTDTVEVELTLPYDLEDFDQEKRDHFIRAIQNLLNLGTVKITRTRPGSTKITVELTLDQASKLQTAVKQGELKSLGILSSKIKLSSFYFKYKDVVRDWVMTKVGNKADQQAICPTVWRQVSKYIDTYSESEVGTAKDWLYKLTLDAVEQHKILKHKTGDSFSKLTKSDKDVLMLRLNGFTPEQIGKLLGRKAEEIREQLLRIRKKL